MNYTRSSFKSYVAERTSEIRAEIKRELCTTVNRISDKLEKVDWKKVGIAVLATAATVGVGVLTGGAGLAAAGALGLKGTLGGAIVAGAVTGAIGGATYGGTSSILSGNDLKQVAKDTLVGGATGSLTGGAMGGLAYGADKAVGALKNLMTGGSKPKPGHITEMATKKLNSDDVEIPLLEDKRTGQLALPDKSGSTPKNVFPDNPDDLLPEIPRNKVIKDNGTASQVIQTSDSIRIRAEQHTLLPGETYNPRHHGVHYHVEYKADSTKSWNNKKNIKKWYPEGYTPGAGSGFIPGESFPK